MCAAAAALFASRAFSFAASALSSALDGRLAGELAVKEVLRPANLPLLGLVGPRLLKDALRGVRLLDLPGGLRGELASVAGGSSSGVVPSLKDRLKLAFLLDPKSPPLLPSPPTCPVLTNR